jgi:DNA-binding Xre family transcriptional regulator
MPRQDSLALIRALLRTALAALPESPHSIEDTLGIGHGTLLRLLDGRMELKLRHLLQLCELLKIHPRDLIERGLPNWKATQRLDDWLPPGQRKAAQPLALSEEVLQAIRAAVREEVSHAGRTPRVVRQKSGRDR